MESRLTLDQLKANELPSDWAEKNSGQAQVIRRLISPLPLDRPSAAEIKGLLAAIV